jgi:hypothetical protein
MFRKLPRISQTVLSFLYLYWNQNRLVLSSRLTASHIRLQGQITLSSLAAKCRRRSFLLEERASFFNLKKASAVTTILSLRLSFRALRFMQRAETEAEALVTRIAVIRLLPH